MMVNDAVPVDTCRAAFLARTRVLRARVLPEGKAATSS